VVLSNMAVCLISLNDFARALSSYRQARKVCEKAGMPLLVAQADYNVAYLYYLRGEYGSAIERLYAARRACEATGDAYHFALCHPGFVRRLSGAESERRGADDRARRFFAL